MTIYLPFLYKVLSSRRIQEPYNRNILFQHFIKWLPKAAFLLNVRSSLSIYYCYSLWKRYFRDEYLCEWYSHHAKPQLLGKFAWIVLYRNLYILKQGLLPWFLWSQSLQIYSGKIYLKFTLWKLLHNIVCISFVFENFNNLSNIWVAKSN